MGLFSSSSDSDRTYNTTSSAGQVRAGKDSQNLSGVTLGSGARLRLTDQGAVEKAFAFAGKALTQTNQSAQRAFGSAVKATREAQERSGAVNADQLAKLGLAAMVGLALIFGYVMTRGVR